jgi:antitoxin component of MazEF toxin-antitoxin module
MLTARVMRVGNSLCVVIPSAVAKMMSLKERDSIDLIYDGRRTLSVRASDKRVRRFAPVQVPEARHE